MTVHTCTRCPLRFTNRAELADHMAHDHRVPPAVLQAMTYPGAHESQPLYRSFTADDGVHRILLIANQTLGSDAVMATIDERLRDHGREQTPGSPAPGGAVSVYVLVPATPSEHLATAPGAGRPASAARGLDARTDDAGMAQARWRLRRMVGLLTDAGVVCHGRIGDPNPMTAVAQVMAEEQIDEIILCTLEEGLSRWLRADVPTALRRTYDVPVTVIRSSWTDRMPPGEVDVTDGATSTGFPLARPRRAGPDRHHQVEHVVVTHRDPERTADARAQMQHLR